jgi:hypothetical protein
MPALGNLRGRAAVNIADLATPAPLAVPDEHGAATLIEIGLGQRKRFLDAPPGAPQDHDGAHGVEGRARHRQRRA